MKSFAHANTGNGISVTPVTIKAKHPLRNGGSPWPGAGATGRSKQARPPPSPPRRAGGPGIPKKRPRQSMRSKSPGKPLGRSLISHNALVRRCAVEKGDQIVSNTFPGTRRLPGEGSIPVPLSPPPWPKQHVLRVSLWGVRPNGGSDFSFELRTPSRQGALIILRTAHLSPKLCIPRIRYGSRNSNVSKGCVFQQKEILRLLSDRRGIRFLPPQSGVHPFRRGP